MSTGRIPAVVGVHHPLRIPEPRPKHAASINARSFVSCSQGEADAAAPECSPACSAERSPVPVRHRRRELTSELDSPASSAAPRPTPPRRSLGQRPSGALA